MCGLFSSLFSWAGRLFANCSNLPQKIATIVWHNKGALRENGTDIPHNLRKVLPQPMQAHFPAGAAAAAAHSRPIKKLSPVSMRGNSQNGGQTTKSLLTKPQCSGVPIQQAVSLSSSFPRHCLLFVCAFFREMQAGSWSEELPLPPVLRKRTAPASIAETGAVRLLLMLYFSDSGYEHKGFVFSKHKDLCSLL